MIKALKALHLINGIEMHDIQSLQKYNGRQTPKHFHCGSKPLPLGYKIKKYPNVTLCQHATSGLFHFGAEHVCFI